jgi:hypothetical protein
MLVPESTVLAHSTPSQSRRAKFMPVVRVAAGNALEMYDFQIFGYYATAIAATFFPTGHEFASLMLALATFGAGFWAPISIIEAAARACCSHSR